MNHQILKQILESLANGHSTVAQAQQRLQNLAMEDIDYAHIDHHRSLRKGFPEVLFGEGKTAEQIVGIMNCMQSQEHVILVTRIDAEKAQFVQEKFPHALYDSQARLVVCQKEPLPKTGRGTILVVSAGTSDIPVAREAYLTADAMGNQEFS